MKRPQNLKKLFQIDVSNLVLTKQKRRFFSKIFWLSQNMLTLMDAYINSRAPHCFNKLNLPELFSRFSWLDNVFRWLLENILNMGRRVDNNRKCVQKCQHHLWIALWIIGYFLYHRSKKDSIINFNPK